MADQDIPILQALEAAVARSAERYEAAADGAADPRLVTPLNDRAGERRRAAAALDETAREMGASGGGGGGIAGSFGRIADGLRTAASGSDDRATLASLASLEAELERQFTDALGEDLSPRARGEIDAIAGSFRDARAMLDEAIAAHMAP